MRAGIMNTEWKESEWFDEWLKLARRGDGRGN
jgi:hypothetical protein